QAANNLQNAGQRSQAQQNLSRAANQVRDSSRALGAPNDQGTTFSGSPSGASSDGLNPGDPSGMGDPSARGGRGGQQGNEPGSGGNPGDGQGGSDGRGSGGQGAETVYVGPGTHPEGVSGRPGPNGQVQSQDDNSLANPSENGSNVPYQQVVGQYQ